MKNTYCPISWGARRYNYAPFTQVEIPQAITNPVQENLGTASAELTGAELAPINAAVENVVGCRYQEEIP